MRNLTRRRKILFAFIAVCIVFGILLSFLPAISERIAVYIMTANNISNPVFDIAKMDYGSIDINEVRGVYPDSGHQISFSVNKLRVTYSLLNLLKGHVDGLDIESLDLQVTGDSKDIQNQGSGLSMPVPERWRDSIPVSIFAIRQFNFAVEGKHTYSVHGDVQLDEDSLTAQLELLTGNLSPLQIKASVQARDTSGFVIERSDLQQKLLVMNVAPITIANGQAETKFTLDMDAGGLYQALREIGFALGMPKMSGSMHVAGLAKLPVGRSEGRGGILSSVQVSGTGSMHLEVPLVNNIAKNTVIDFPMSFELMEGVVKVQPNQAARLTMTPVLQAIFASNANSPISKIAKQTLVVRPSEDFSCTFDMTRIQEDIFFVQTSGSIHAVYGGVKDALNLVITISGLQVTDLEGLQASAEIDYKAILSDRGLSMSDRVSLSGKINVEGSTSALQLALSPMSRNMVSNFSQGDFAIASLNAVNSDQVACKYAMTSGEWSCEPFSMKLQSEGQRYKEIRLQASENNVHVRELKGNSNDWTLKSDAVLDRVILQAGDTALKLDRIETSFQLNKNTAQAKVNISGANKSLLGKFKVEHKMGSGTGIASYNVTTEKLSSNKNILAQLFDKLPYPLSLQNGKAIANGKLSWHPDKTKRSSLIFEHNANASIINAGGKYQNIDFSGLSAQFILSGFPELEARAVSGLHVDMVDPGIPITGIDMQPSLSGLLAGKPKVRIENLRAHLLGGKIVGQLIELDLERSENPFSLEIAEIDIGELLKLEQDKGLYGTGIVDGVLPIVITRDGVHMSEGKLQARAPGGVLKYIAKESVRAMANTNPNLKLLLSALENFQYHLLAAGVQYEPDGKLVLNMKLEGRNPDFEGGRAIHLNIQVEENVLTLMRSLRLGDEIGTQIEERIKQRGSP